MLFTVLFVLEVQPQSPTAAKLKSAGKDVAYAGYFSLVTSVVIGRIAIISRKIAAAATAKTTKVEEYNIFLSLFNFLDHQTILTIISAAFYICIFYFGMDINMI